ncbi:MAG: MFS transporter [Actinomycetota bacterium]|nr:MFS transporter [Actinomycetota bacterium]
MTGPNGGPEPPAHSGSDVPGDEFRPFLRGSGRSLAISTRVFGSAGFFRLWLAQVVSATGDWLGLLAISLLAIRLGAGNEGAALSLVLAARIVPGFFFGPVAGVLVDRWDRKKVMVTCDIGRAAVMVTLPFIETILGLFVASLLLEAFTMLWSPAKEASVPNLVSEDQLATANSLSLAAAYGTFPLGAALMAVFGRLATALFDSSWADNARLDDMGLAFYANALSFLITAYLITTLSLPHRPRATKQAARGRRARLADPIAEMREGWKFIFVNPVVRTVNTGLAMGFIGGGMLVPLGAIYADEILGAGKAGFGSVLTAFGLGAAFGAVLVSSVQRRFEKTGLFNLSLIGAGVFLVTAASTSQIYLHLTMVFAIGTCTGAVWVLGLTLLHATVEDHLRGRIFATLYLLIRACVLLALVIAPLIEDGLDRLSEVLWHRHVDVFGLSMAVPGVRLTLWLAGLIILASGVLSVVSLRAGSLVETDSEEGL